MSAQGSWTLAKRAFFEALEYSRIEEIKKMLNSKKVDANTELPGLCSALMFALRHSSLETIKLLIQHGAKVNHEINGSETPLFVALRENSPESVKVLIEHGANVNHKTVQGNYPIMIAVIEKNSPKIIELLLDNGVNVNHLYSTTGATFTPLIWAFMHGSKNLESAKLLLDKGADINQTTAEGETAFSAAMGLRNPAAVQLLIDYGLDCPALTQNGGGVLSEEGRQCILAGNATWHYESTEEMGAGDTPQDAAISIGPSAAICFGPSAAISTGPSAAISIGPSAAICFGPGCSKDQTDGKLRMCSRCKIARYCSNKCQKTDWPDHKKLCFKESLVAANSTEVSARVEQDHTEGVRAHPGLQSRSDETGAIDDSHGEALSQALPTKLQVSCEDEQLAEADLVDTGGQTEDVTYEDEPKSAAKCFGPGCSKDQADGFSKLRKCSRCKFARYCSTECLKGDWVDHKKWCENAAKVVSDRKARTADKEKKPFDMEDID